MTESGPVSENKTADFERSRDLSKSGRVSDTASGNDLEKHHFREYSWNNRKRVQKPCAIPMGMDVGSPGRPSSPPMALTLGFSNFQRDLSESGRRSPRD